MVDQSILDAVVRALRKSRGFTLSQARDFVADHVNDIDALKSIINQLDMGAPWPLPDGYQPVVIPDFSSHQDQEGQVRKARASKKQPMQRFTCLMPDSMLDDLWRLSEADGLPSSQHVRFAVAEYLKRKKGQD